MSESVMCVGELESTVVLIGAGVVGRAIVQAHLAGGVSIGLIDQNADAVRWAANQIQTSATDWEVSAIRRLRLRESDPTLFGIEWKRLGQNALCESRIVIESIAERLIDKQELLVELENEFADSLVLCSNTSTLSIDRIADALDDPSRLCGMHFFMPVDQRSAVEVVRGPRTSDPTVAVAKQHVELIQKQPLIVGDGPGFVVNRMLAPYLNEAMLLLGRGVDAAQIEQAALSYGMPISPLELVDWIGARTVFDAGRVFWQSFPNRISPSPIAPALVKNKRDGRNAGGGFYDYDSGIRRPALSDAAQDILASYRRPGIPLNHSDVISRLAIPMWIEAVLAIRDGVAIDTSQIETAMLGGLGYARDRSWLEFFDHLGSREILAQSRKWVVETAAMGLPSWIETELQQRPPSKVLASALP